MRRIISKIWPQDVAPGLRSKLVKLRSRSLVRLHFELWRHYSQKRYGKHRPINAHGTELIARSNDWRAFWVHKQGGSQQDLMTPWQRLVDLNPELSIDVGANYGEFSKPVADRVEHLLAIEANPVICECLEKTLTETNVTVANVAATDEPGTVTIYSKDDLSGYSSLSKEVMTEKSSPAGTDDAITSYEIEAVTLDDLVERTYGNRPESLVLKVDVEGFEEAVLRGATNLFAQVDWWRAIVEFSQQSIRARGADPANYWHWLCQFDGYILDDETTNSDFTNLSDSLPAEMPDHGNLLIGRGNTN